MFIVETVTTEKGVCTSYDVMWAYFGTSPGTRKGDFEATLDIEKNAFPPELPSLN